MKIKIIKYFLLILLIAPFLCVALFWMTLSPDDKEWFTGKEWKKRTAEIRLELNDSKLVKDYEIFRYEDSDWVEIWGTDGQYIDLGSTEPSRLINTDCMKILQLNEHSFTCRRLDSSEFYTNLCFKYAFPNIFNKEETVDLDKILSRHAEVSQTLEDQSVITYFDERFSSEVKCSISEKAIEEPEE